jgi:hypothetical protein
LTVLPPARTVVGGLAIASVLLLGGCTTTQERSAKLAAQAETAAQAKRFNVGRTNPVVKVRGVTLLTGPDANAVAVKVENTSNTTQVMVPIGVDLYDAKDQSLFTNRVDGLDAPLNNIPVVEPGVSWWVNNQLPPGKVARTRVRIGTSRTEAPSSLPRMTVSGLELTEDAGVQVARGKVENESAVAQRRLALFAVALKDGRVVAAGRSVVDKLGPKGSARQRFNVYFTGDPASAELTISAPPSILGDASNDTP